MSVNCLLLSTRKGITPKGDWCIHIGYTRRVTVVWNVLEYEACKYKVPILSQWVRINKRKIKIWLGGLSGMFMRENMGC